MKKNQIYFQKKQEQKPGSVRANDQKLRKSLPPGKSLETIIIILLAAGGMAVSKLVENFQSKVPGQNA
jgi:hypothetical protein